MRQLSLAGIPIRDTTADVFTRFLTRRLKARRRTVVCFANANMVMCCRHLTSILSTDPNIFVVNDGIAVDIAARLRRYLFRENMNGTDFIPAFLSRASTPIAVYLLGSGQESVRGAAAALNVMPNVRVVGYQDGYSMWNDISVLRRVNEARPDILIVALGNPLQEEWILNNGPLLEVPVIFGAGALLEFLSKTKPRAPGLVRRMHLEWAFRLALEPRRLFKRYTIGTLHFFLLALSSKSTSLPSAE